MIEEQSKKQRSAATLIVMGCTLVTRILGFIKIAVINAVFGASGQADVLNAVFSIPNNLRKLMAEGALSSAFIPQLNKHLVKNEAHKAQQLTQLILGFQYIVLVPLIIVAIIFSQRATRIFLHFSSPEEMVLADSLFKYFIPYLLIVSISAVMMAILNSHQKFLVAALSPLLFSVVMIVAILTTHQHLGVYSMAVGVLGGGLVQLAIQIFPCRKEGYNLLPKFTFQDPSFRVVLRHWLPVVLTSSVFAINQQVAVYLASSLESGSSSALANAIVFFQLPYGLFFASVNTVYFPQMSRRAEADDSKGLIESFISGLRVLLYLLVPASFIMILLGKEIISVAFMRGAFRPQNAKMAAEVLTGFCVGMFFVAAYNFIQRFYYSKASFKTPLFSAIMACIFDVTLSLVLIRTPLKVAGLAYANSLSFALCFVILSIIAYKKYQSIHLGKLLKPLGHVTIICGLIFATYSLLVHFLGNFWWQKPSSIATFALLSLYGLSLLGVTLACFFLFKIPIIEDLKKRSER